MEHITLLGHVAIEVILGPEAAEEVLGQVKLGPCMLVLVIKYYN